MTNERKERVITLELEDSPLPQQESMTVLDVATALALRKAFILKMTIAAALAGAVVAFLIPNHYVAVAKVLAPQTSQSSTAALLSSVASNPLAALAAGAGKELGIRNSNDLYAGLLKTRPVADALIQRFGLQKVYRDRDMTSTRKDLAAHTEVVTGKDGLISVSVDDGDKARAAAIANAYIEETRRLTKGLALTEASERRLFYDEQLKQAKDDLANAEVEFKQAQQRSGVISIDAQGKALIEAIAALRARSALKQAQLNALRSYATDENIEVSMVQREIDGMQTQLNRLEKRSAEPGSYDFSLKNAPESGLAFIRAFREVKYRESLFELLARQYEAARLDEAKDAPLIQVVEPAIPPDRHSFPHRILLILIAGAAGFCMACLGVIVGVRESHSKEDPRYAEQLRLFRAALLGR